MFNQYILIPIIGLSSGLLVSGGVFTVLVSIGLIPRFAGKTHTGNHILIYEECVVFGTLAGGIFSIFNEQIQIGKWFLVLLDKNWVIISQSLLVIIGMFAGIFVGCLALATAEMLNSIPIFSRRIGFRHGLGLAVTSMAIGKLAGSLYYFFGQMWTTM